MSKVYEALKKAHREGRWRDDADEAKRDGPAALPVTESASATPIGESEPELQSGRAPVAAAHINQNEQEATRLAISRGPSIMPDARLSRTEAAHANGLDAGKGMRGGAACLADKHTHGWRFWRQPSSNGVRGPRLIINQESFSRAAEQFQVLRANLESWALERDQRVILITSALPGEGKSFVAVNLAVALARAGSRVLAVDVDLRRPSLHLPFNLVPLGGLLPYLEGEAEFDESVTTTPESHLRLIAASGTTLSGPEALAGSRMKSFIESARQLQPPHIILLDAPAAMAGTETQILSKLVDGVLLVVAANMTPRAAVTKTLELIKGTQVLSVVLNRFEYSYSASRHLYYHGRYKPDIDA